VLWTGDLLGWCLEGLGVLADWPWAAFALPEAPAWTWAAATLGVALLLAPRGLPGRIPGLVLCLPILLLRPPPPAPGEAWLTLLDVGQGLAAVVRTASGTLVYDTGPGYPSGFDTGEAVLLPFLESRGVRRVDVLVVSHADRDHNGGTASLVARIGVDRVLSGEPHDLGIPGAEPCVAGAGWEWSGVRFRFLYPDAEALASGLEGNNASCVLRVEAGGRSLLFTGDITAGVERRLVEALGDGLASDVLVAGHHGSATSTSAELLDAVSPTWVLFAVGYANPFGFPAAEVQGRVRARGIATRDTAVDGAVTLHLGPDGALAGPWTWREQARRPWTHRPPRGDPSGP
jgi:competence protein ComEC